MFYSEQLLSRDGPLAYVWLAANLERKLTKQQLLNTSITESAKAIVSSSSNSNEITMSQRAFIDSHDIEPLALRLTGQLLYGVVRIYSRKAKYLFDDVTDALLKLKSSFKTSQSVILPAESTVITSMKTVTLQDTVTEADLLYQEPLNFDELLATQQQSRPQFPSQTIMEEDSYLDHSVEVPRSRDVDELQGMEDDLELDLDFDLEDRGIHGDNNDQSVELGRAADDANASLDPMQQQDDGFELELPDFDEPMLDLDAPQSPMHIGDSDGPTTPTQNADIEVLGSGSADRQQKKKRQAHVFQNTDVVRTVRKRLVVDDTTEIPAEQMRANQADYPPIPAETIQSESVDVKLQQVLELAQGPTSSSEFLNFNLQSIKRRKLGPNAQSSDLSMADGLEQQQDDFELPSFQNNFGGFEDPLFQEDDQQPYQQQNNEGEERPLLPELDDEIETFEQNNITMDPTSAVSKSTVKIARQLRSKFAPSGSIDVGVAVTFSDVMQDDLETNEPLSKNPKREATRAFFEMLVLATSDSVALKQDRLFGEITITAKDSLMDKFL